VKYKEKYIYPHILYRILQIIHADIVQSVTYPSDFSNDHTHTHTHTHTLTQIYVDLQKVPLVFLSVWNNSNSTGRIFIKFYI